MVFSSVFFIFLFLPITILINFCLSKNINYQNLFLMLISLLFYYWGEQNHIWIMLLCILINYFSGIAIYKAKSLVFKKIFLAVAVIASIGLLCYFKYYNFFIESISDITKTSFGDFKNIALPLGISFYTFHALSYSIDVYHGKIPSEKNIVRFIGYVSLFPQLVAGPIVRYRDIRHSFFERYITRVGFRNGICRFSFGLAKKVLIANTVGVLADNIFKLNGNSLDFIVSWLGLIAYTLQIYFDFSGYSDMAIGIGLMLGFKYKENFRFPYSALSIKDFWRKWHISLSSWLRDYLYIPLGGNRSSVIRTYFNLFLVFLICGLWHGASYNFVIWGMYYGLFLVLERLFLGNVLSKIPKVLRHIYVLFVVMIGWVFFRADTLSVATYYLKNLFNFEHKVNIIQIIGLLNPIVVLMIILGVIISFGISDKIRIRIVKTKNILLINYFRVISISSALILLVISILALSNNSYSPFLYFRF